MTERQLAFIDTDDNLLELWLKDDRVALCVVDSRPELEAGELRAFASVLFATYVAGPLITRLGATQATLGELRDRLLAIGGNEQMLAALDGSLRPIAEVTRAIAGLPPAPPVEPDLPVAPKAAQTAGLPGRRRRPVVPRRAREGSAAGWGWRRGDDGDLSA